MLSFPPSWVISSLIPLTLCKMQVQDVMKPIVCGGEGRDGMGCENTLFYLRCKQLSYGQ